jgi:hypothetical protein
VKTRGSQAYERRRFGGVTVTVWTYSGDIKVAGDLTHTTPLDREYAEAWVEEVCRGWDLSFDAASAKRRLWRGTLPGR